MLLVGTLILAPGGALGAGIGEAMIVLATLCWAVEVVVVRRVLVTGVSPSLAAAARMVVGSATLFVLVAIGGGLDGIAAYGPAQWQAIAITAILLTGYVATWYGALRRAPASLRHQRARARRGRHDGAPGVVDRRRAGPEPGSRAMPCSSSAAGSRSSRSAPGRGRGAVAAPEPAGS